MAIFFVISAAMRLPTRLMAADVTKESPMKEVMQKQFQVGKKIVFGVFQQDVDSSSIPSAAEQARLEANAATKLVNIDDAERARRRSVGLVAGGVAAAVYAAMLSFHVTLIPRFIGLYLPLAVSAGFLKSAEEGL